MLPQAPEYIRNLVPYVPGKPIGETQREYRIRKVLKLASNENPLGPSPKAIAALKNEIKEAHRYPDGSAYQLKQILSTHLGCQPRNLIIGNGSNEVIDMLIRTYCIPGDVIVTSQAAFVAYRLCAQIQGVGTIETRLTPDLRFDLKAMLEEILANSKVRLVFIANPNNPTGTYVTQSELLPFLKEVSTIRQGSVLVVLDYAYWEYVTAKDLPDPMSIQKGFENVVVLRTFSKIYGLAGLRIGYGIGHSELISTVERVRQPFNVNSLALSAAVGALSDRAFVWRSRKLNEAGMVFWEKNLRALQIPFWKSQGNFLLADVRAGLDMSGADVYQACLKQGIIFRPVTNYGLQNALRISIGTPSENRSAVRALAVLQKSKRGK